MKMIVIFPTARGMMADIPLYAFDYKMYIVIQLFKINDCTQHNYNIIVDAIPCE